MRRPPLCACGHDAGDHPLYCGAAGSCVAELPEDLAAELPAWRCPCRRYRYSATTTALTVRSRTLTSA